MPTAAAKPKAKPLSVRDLCRELLVIERDNPAIFARIGEIKTLLKVEADATGKIREVFAEKDLVGFVSASPSKPEETLGEGPEIVVGAWNQLPNHRQQKLIEQGLVKIEPIVKGAYPGQVRSKLDSPAKGAAT
jgi:hypothetical protein